MWLSRLLLATVLATIAVQPSLGQSVTDLLKSDCDVSEDALSSVANADIPRTCIEFKGRTRCYYTYIPPCASGDIPLVIDLHPLAACPSTYVLYSGWFQKATTQCFAIVWPIGITDPDEVDDICWAVPAGEVDLNPAISTRAATPCCCTKFGTETPLNPIDPEEVGDADFVRLAGTEAANQIASDTAIDARIDTKRIYVTGHSNGCYLGFAMAMLHSDFVAAMGCMSGLWVTPPADNYNPTPMWSLIGERDIIVPASGRDASGAFAPSFDYAFGKLQQLNGCGATTSTEIAIPEMDTFLGRGGLTTTTATGCQNNATVEFLTLNTGGHTPFLGVPEQLPPPPLATDTTIDTTGLAWDFLSTRQLDEVPPEFVVIPTVAPSAAPTSPPSPGPSPAPTPLPTGSPSVLPTPLPSAVPSPAPTPRPSTGPSLSPTSMPSNLPSPSPSGAPSKQPTELPSSRPTNDPTTEPSVNPTSSPTDAPTQKPTSRPSNEPSVAPSTSPSLPPTPEPTEPPSLQPTMKPSSGPTGNPTAQPTSMPTEPPSPQPTMKPSSGPTGNPTAQPTSMPSEKPSSPPSSSPSTAPSANPTVPPTASPTPGPSQPPSSTPTEPPTSKPSTSPTDAPVGPLCGEFRDSCRVASDCCSDRCVLSQCQLPITNSRARISGTRGGAASSFLRNGA